MGARFLRRRPSPAMIVALLALFVAVGGGSALAAFVVSSNSQVAPNTIYGANKPSTANDNVVDDSLTGADIKEGSLAQVPTAAHAVNADKLGGKAASSYATHCGGTVRAAGFCVVGAKHASTTWFDATNDCASRGLKLPTVAQGMIIVPSGSTSDATWADAPFMEGGIVHAFTVANGGGLHAIFDQSADSTSAYYCVADAY